MNDAVDSIGKLAHALTEAPITDIVRASVANPCTRAGSRSTRP